MNEADVERVARAICDSRQYNGVNGTCAARCMERLGDARSGHGCPRAVNIHGGAARAAIAAMQDTDAVEQERKRCAGAARLESMKHLANSDQRVAEIFTQFAISIEKGEHGKG